jgi:glycerol-3-phosphate dehydrogenase
MRPTLAGFRLHGKMPAVKTSPPPRDSYDILVVGGGINGTGIARDARGRGYSVLLCEQHDLAAHTSSSSTKLIHGGLRYLEGFHFSLVRKALQEREVLLAAGPHVMRPLRFVMPHDEHLRPAWMIRAGLFLYDNLAKRRRLAGSASLDLRTHPAGTPLKRKYGRGFIYSDGWADDARVVVLNARDAADRGAQILTRTRCESLIPEHSSWRAVLDENGARREVHARAVVNATGPWVSHFLSSATRTRAIHTIRLVKGSHIVVPQIFTHRFAYIFQNVDRRIVFAIPYEDTFTLIGTTGVDFHGDPASVRINDEEIRYLCTTVNRYFERQTAPSEVVWSYSGVRPLLDDDSGNASSVTRDYSLDLDLKPLPLLSVFGGKITTYRKLAETAVDKLDALLGPRGEPWTASAALPGGDFSKSGPRGKAQPAGFAAFLRTVEKRYPWLPAELRVRLSRAYGTRLERLIGNAHDLGEEVLPGLHEREINYLRDQEWARTAQDILWRRSKLGLHLPPDSAARLDAWLSGRY